MLVGQWYVLVLAYVALVLASVETGYDIHTALIARQ